MEGVKRGVVHSAAVTDPKKKELPSISIEGTSENEYELKDGKIVRKRRKEG